MMTEVAPFADTVLGSLMSYLQYQALMDILLLHQLHPFAVQDRCASQAAGT